MAKNRKGSSRADNNAASEPSLDTGESRKRIRYYEDVADSEDEFHLNRDTILLDEGPDAKRRRKLQEQEEFLQASDEEVLGYSASEAEDNVELVDQRHGRGAAFSESVVSDDEGENDEDSLRWGTTKDDIYGADEIETEEQALEEEAEALRLQKKQLQSMTEADYGFDEADWQDGSSKRDLADDGDGNVITEVLPQLQIAADMKPAERLRLLKSRYPEFEPLSKELLQLQKQYEKLRKHLQSQDTLTGAALPNTKTQFRAASAYLGALAMYFTLLTSPAVVGGPNAVALSATQLRDHSIMEKLVQCRELWLRAKTLPQDSDPTLTKPEPVVETVPVSGSQTIELLPSGQAVTKSIKKSRAQKHAEAAQLAAESRRAERMQRTEADLADLDALVAPFSKRTTNKRANYEAFSDVGEEAPLTTQEAAEKAKRKKSLRFYTSQIAQKVNKRGAAGRNAGGDDDIPYRERLKDRQARLNAEAEKRGRSNNGDNAELGGELDEEDLQQAQDIRAGAEDEDYYDLVAARTAKKKAHKVAFSEAQRQAALQGGRVIPEESVGPDGKRKITYAIEKNKGLTPHRKKEVRNPRVKKRKKYDEKKKKLGSIKPVYKGGEGRGGYTGELTGIKKGLVKSTKL